jgi:hypothetical protein
MCYHRRVSRWTLAALLFCACRGESAPQPLAPSPPTTVALPAPEPEDAGATTPDASDEAAVEASAPSGKPAWVSTPFDDLPPPPAGKNLDVEIRVVAGKTFPVKLIFPELGKSTEIFDDLVSRPHCRSEKSEGKNAIKLECLSMDGAFALRAHQDGRDLVLDVYSWGDAPPSLRGPTRITLPEGRRARFVLKL